MWVGRKWAYLAVAIAVMVEGCGSVADRVGEELVEELLEGSGIEDVEIDQDDGSIIFTVETEEGDQTMRMGGGLPADFPFPLPDEYEVTTAFEIGEGDQKAFSAILVVPADDFDKVTELYENFLNDEGFEVTKENMLAGDTRFVFLTGARDDVAAIITLSVEGDEGGLNLHWEPKN